MTRSESTVSKAPCSVCGDSRFINGPSNDGGWNCVEPCPRCSPCTAVHIKPTGQPLSKEGKAAVQALIAAAVKEFEGDRETTES